MCVIIAKEYQQQKPSKSILEDCYTENDDLCGIAFVNPTSKLVTVFRGLTLPRLLEINDSLPDDTRAIYHFRIATSGVVNTRNSHPFPLYANKFSEKTRCKLAIAHNGVIEGGNKKYSDTALLIDWIESNQLSDVSYLLSLLSNNSNKFATIDYMGDVILYGFFHEKYGLNFSNLYWDGVYSYNWKMPTKNHVTSYTSTTPNTCDVCYQPPQNHLVYDRGLYLCESCLASDNAKYLLCDFCEQYSNDIIYLDDKTQCCGQCYDNMKALKDNFSE